LILIVYYTQGKGMNIL